MDESDDVTNGEVRQQSVFFSKEMLPCKLLFFFAYGAMGAFAPYYSMYYKSSGLTAASIGLRSGITGCLSLIMGPLWGSVFDFINRRMCIAILLYFGTTLLNCSIPWIIMAVPNAPSNSSNTTNTSTATVLEKDSDIGTVRKDPHILFWVLLTQGVLSDIFSTGFGTFSEGVVVNVIYTRKTKPVYGQQKVFGPIGFALGVFITGLAIDHYRPKHFSPYAASVYIYFPFSAMMLPCVLILAKQANWNYGKRSDLSISIWQHLASVLKKPENTIFLLSVVISGFLYSSFEGFLSLFIMDNLNTTKTIISLISVISVLSELFFYPFSSQIIAGCGGPIACVFIGILAWVLRLTLTSYCTHAYYVLPIQLLHGACLSLSWTAMVQHTYCIFPKEVTTTALGFLMQLHFGAPGILTSIVGGQVYRQYGGRKLFRGAASIGGFWLIVMVLYFVVLKKGRLWLEGRRRGNDTMYNPLMGDNIHGVQVEDEPIEGICVTSSTNKRQNNDY